MSENTTQHDFTLWTEAQLSESIGVPLRTIRGWRTRGGGPRFVKLGGSVRYRPGSVAAWLEEAERESTGSHG